MAIEASVPIERLHRAAQVLSVVAIVVVLGCAAAIAYGQLHQYPRFFVGQMPAFIISVVLSFGLSILPAAVMVLVSVFAWAERRTGWLVAVLLVELLAMCVPVYGIWYAIKSFGGYYQHDETTFALVYFAIDVVQIIPLALAFAFSRSRNWTPRDAEDDGLERTSLA